MNNPITNTLPCFIFCLLSSISFAQPTRSLKSFLETRLTESIGPSDFTQYFRFADTMFPDRFTVIQQKNSVYTEYDLKLTHIKAMDIVSQDTTVALALTFHTPLTVVLRADIYGKQIDTEERQILTFPLGHYREALYVQRALQDADNMLDFRIRRQESDTAYPEMRPMPEMKSRPVSIGKYPITVQQYRTYCLAQQTPMPPAPPWGWHADHPIVGITWQEAKDYVLWLSQYTGHHYDLPPRHVWQYAALTKKGETFLDEVAWWGENAQESTQPVGQKLPNDFGLYDMQGNVWEWLEEPENDLQRTAAGGSWDSHFAQCQWSSTTQFYAAERDFTVGFRVLRYDK